MNTNPPLDSLAARAWGKRVYTASAPKVRNTTPGRAFGPKNPARSEEHTSELQSLAYLVCRLLLEKKKKKVFASIASLPLKHDLRGQNFRTSQSKTCRNIHGGHISDSEQDRNERERPGDAVAQVSA